MQAALVTLGSLRSTFCLNPAPSVANTASTSRSAAPQAAPSSPPPSPPHTPTGGAKIAPAQPTPPQRHGLPASSVPVLTPECLPAGCGTPVELAAGDPGASPGASPSRAPSPAQAALSPELLQRLPAVTGVATVGKGDVQALHDYLVAVAQGDRIGTGGDGGGGGDLEEVADVAQVRHRRSGIPATPSCTTESAQCVRQLPPRLG